MDHIYDKAQRVPQIIIIINQKVATIHNEKLILKTN